MRRSLLAIFVTLAGLLVIWQCRTWPVPEQLPPSTVAGPVLFQPSAAELIYVADFRVTLKGGDRSQEAKTDLNGRYRFYDVAPGKYTVCWESAGWMNGCTPEVEVTAGQSASPQPAELKPSAPDSVVWGTVRLADGSAATLVDRASGVESVPAIAVLDASGRTIGSGHANAAGKYAIGVVGAAATIRATSGQSREELRVTPQMLRAIVSPEITLRNFRPSIASVDVLKGTEPAREVRPGDRITLRPHATDADGDALQYNWQANAGTITSAADGTATWQLPDFPARLSALLTVIDGKGGSDRRVVWVSVGGRVPNIDIAIPGVPPTCSPMSLANVPPPSGYPPTPPDGSTPPFLTFLNATTDHSAAYYENVDPQDLRTTLGKWWKNAGFKPLDGSGGVAKAAYLNWNDLGFGRDMHFNRVGKNVYAWVTNYGCPDNNPKNADLAAKPVVANAIATVCMEYAPVEGTNQAIVKFFVYVGGVKNSPRTGKANLDAWGDRFVPNLCQVCHGTNSAYNGGTNVNLGSSFIPFDLALLRYPNSAVTPPAADLAAYHKMNRIIADHTKPTAAIVNLINGWYTPPNIPPTQNNNYLPNGWKKNLFVPASAASLYRNVLVPGCRTCHYSFSSNKNWDTYQSALADRSYIKLYVCDPGPFMPHAAVTYINFWTNAYNFPTSPPAFLGAYQDKNWATYGGCTGK